MIPWTWALGGVAGVWEAAWWVRRRQRRNACYKAAYVESRKLGRPLVVIGAPDQGVTGGSCGDVTIDTGHSLCPGAIQVDLTKPPLPFADDSCVVLVSCVLEYVEDASPVLREIQRISGGHAYYVGVEPWTLTAHFYPGAKRTLPAGLR
jgi:hypothetical protein